METEKCEVISCPTTLADCHAELRLLKYPDDARLPVWIERTKGKGSTWTPHEQSRICTRHFDLCHFAARKRSNRLVKGAIPTSGVKAAHPVKSSVRPSSASTAVLASGSHLIKSNKVPESTSAQFKHPPPLSEANSSKNSKSAVANTNKVVKNVARKKGQGYKPAPNTKNVTAILQYLNLEEEKEDEYLNKILLRKSVSGLISHVDQLVKETNNPVKELELKSLGFILLKIQKNLGLSAEEALIIFQQEVPHTVYSSLRSFVREDRKQYKALVRSFSLSLNFYSLPAYNYVRNMVHDAIPHPRTISAWYTTIDKYMH